QEAGRARTGAPAGRASVFGTFPFMKKKSLRLASLRLSAVALAAATILAGCSFTPAYQRPTTPEPPKFKELDGWVPAAPADALERGQWWTLFGDPVLNGLAGQVQVSNQNVAAAIAAYTQARSLVAEQRAALWPTATLNLSGDRSGTAGGN